MHKPTLNQIKTFIFTEHANAYQKARGIETENIEQKNF